MCREEGLPTDTSLYYCIIVHRCYTDSDLTIYSFLYQMLHLQLFTLETLYKEQGWHGLKAVIWVTWMMMETAVEKLVFTLVNIAINTLVSCPFSKCINP